MSDLLLTSKSDVRFAIQPRELKNLENGSKNVENAFENDAKLSRMNLRTYESGIKNYLKTPRIELKTSILIDLNLENGLIFEIREDHS